MRARKIHEALSRGENWQKSMGVGWGQKNIEVGTYGGSSDFYDRHEIKEMLDDLEENRSGAMYWCADNLPKWIYVKMLSMNKHKPYSPNEYVDRVILIMQRMLDGEDVYLGVSSNEHYPELTVDGDDLSVLFSL